MNFQNPLITLLKKFQTHRIHYVVIGVSGINYYARDPGNIISTQDFDLLLKPTAKNLEKVLNLLLKQRYSLQLNGEPLGTPDLWVIKKILEHQTTISAVKKNSFRVDLVLNAGGIPYSIWIKRKKIFKIDNVKIPVGDLSQLLQAKQKANRDKDRTFLKLYKHNLQELLKKSKLS